MPRLRLILILLLTFCSTLISLAQVTAQAHVELNTLVRKQLVNPADSTEFAYLTSSSIYRTAGLAVNGALSASDLVVLPNGLFAQDMAFAADGRLLILGSVSNVVDAQIPDSLFLIEASDQGVIQLEKLSGARNTTGRIAVSGDTVFVFEGEVGFAVPNPTDPRAAFHRYELTSGTLISEVYDFGGSRLRPDLDRRFASLHADYHSFYQPLDSGKLLRVNRADLSAEVTTFFGSGDRPYSYQTLSDTLWIAMEDNLSGSFRLQSPSAEIDIPIPTGVGRLRDALLVADGQLIIQKRDQPDKLFFTNKEATSFDSIPFYDAPMVEIIGLSKYPITGERFVFSLGVLEQDRYSRDQFPTCARVTRATFFIDYNNKEDIYQPAQTPIINQIIIQDATRTFQSITLNDSLFEYTANVRIMLDGYANETVGLLYGSLFNVNADRPCIRTQFNSSSTKDFQLVRAGFEDPSVIARILSVDGWPSGVFYFQEIESISGLYSSSKDVYHKAANVFPNPTSDQLTVEVADGRVTTVSWSLISSDGRKYKISPILKAEQTATFSISTLPSGVYQLLGRAAKGVYRTTIVIE